MGEDLHNLSSVLTKLAPALVGVPPGGGAWQKQKFPAGDPVVELVGDRASGKTALLDALYRGYHEQVPTARVDLAEPPYSAAHPEDRDRLDAVNASPVTHLLFKLSYELHKTHRNRIIEFHRLAPALLLITAWRPTPPREGDGPDSNGPDGGPSANGGDGGHGGDGNPTGNRGPAGSAPFGPPVWPAQLAEAEGALRGLLAGDEPPPAPGTDGGGPLDAWLSALTGVVGGLFPAVPGLQGILDAGVTSLRHRKAAEPQWQWWCSRLHHFDGDGVQRLFSLVQDFRAGGALRHAVESHLIAALLTDIDAGYGYWAAKNLHPPLLLLDNVDERLRTRFLDPFVREYGAYRQDTSVRGRKARGKAVLPVAFATSLGHGWRPASGALHPATDPAPWTRQALCPPHSWLLRLGIPPVTDAEIRRMLVGVPQPPALAPAIARLSGGRTGCALLVARAAVTRLRGPEALDLDALLSLPSPDTGQWLGERLLELLLPDARVRAQLRTLAPALDEAEAAALVPLLAPGSNAELRIRELGDSTLGLLHWNHQPWSRDAAHSEPLVTDRALRAVLLYELRAREPEERWSQIHTRLTTHYNPGGIRADDSHQHGPKYLHHALALGRLDSVVVRALHHRYRSDPPERWLRDLNLVAAAPPAFDGYPDAAPAAPTPPTPPTPPSAPSASSAPPACRACVEHDERQGAGAGHAAHTAIRALLATVWRLSGPLAASPDGHGHEDIGTVSRALQTLCTDYGNRSAPDGARNAFVDALARDGWPDALIDGVQAPDLPSREGSRR